MSVIDQSASAAPILAAPIPPQGPMSLWRFVRTLRDNSLATYRAEAYSADIIATRLLWRRTFFLNEPTAIKHVLLDNAANYHKTEITRRLL
ncbi:MAG: cytochrome P450, partial [Roseiarcus sp.]